MHEANFCWHIIIKFPFIPWWWWFASYQGHSEWQSDESRKWATAAQLIKTNMPTTNGAVAVIKHTWINLHVPGKKIGNRIPCAPKKKKTKKNPGSSDFASLDLQKHVERTRSISNKAPKLFRPWNALARCLDVKEAPKKQSPMELPL